MRFILPRFVRAALLCALLALFFLPAAACARMVRQPLPELSDPVDLHVASLAIFSQQEELVADIDYWNSTLSQRGCAPVSIANALFAALGVTDRQQAAGAVSDLLPLITPSYKHLHKPVRFGLITHALQPENWYRPTEKLPDLYALLRAFLGEIIPDDEALTAQNLARRLDSTDARPLLISGTGYLSSSWSDIAGALCLLHARGMDDAVISLGHMGSGTNKTDGPMRTSGYGHYIALYIHVGKFFEDGSVYVLDSLPRAIEGEEYGGEYELRSQYHFVEASRCQTFRDTFAASRISPTVIRLSYTDEALKKARAAETAAYESAEARQLALSAAHTQLLSPIELYSAGVAFVAVP